MANVYSSYIMVKYYKVYVRMYTKSGVVPRAENP